MISVQKLFIVELSNQSAPRERASALTGIIRVSEKHLYAGYPVLRECSDDTKRKGEIGFE